MRSLVFWCFAFWLLSSSMRAAELPLTRISDVRSLSRDEAAKAVPVLVRGVITWRVREDGFALQDETGGIRVQLFIARDRGLWEGTDAQISEFREGMEVEVEGVSHAAGYAPTIAPRTIRVLGRKALPPARPLDRLRFLNGVEAGQRLEAHGVILGVQLRGDRWNLRMQTGADTILVMVHQDALAAPYDLLDAEVIVRGIGASGFNTRGELLFTRILVSIPEDIVVTKPRPAGAEAVPRVALDQLRAFQSELVTPHRRRIEGTVVFVRPGQLLYVQEASRVVRVESRSDQPVQAGDRIEAVGYVDMTRHIAMLGGSEVRKIGTGERPPPTPITPSEIIAINAAAVSTGQSAQPHDFDGHLIRFRAQLLAVQSPPDGPDQWRQLTLKQDNLIVEAILHEGNPADLDVLQPGSELEVTGLAELEYTEQVGSWPFIRPTRVGLTLREPGDVTVITSPSWWTPGRLLAITGLVGLMLGASLLWAWQLRRQVTRKTHQLAEEMRARRDAAVEFQATLRERNRLAANLHDTLLQTMGGIGFQLEACEAEAARARTVDEPGVHLEVAHRMLDHAVDELRGSVWALRSLPLHGLDLPDALRALAERAGAGQTAHIEVQTEGDLTGVSDFVAGNLLLAAQEALHNALKHGRPRTVILRARPGATPQHIALDITDDGSGFVVEQAAGANQGHFGITGMRERIERLQGTLHVASAPGRGTTITLEVPLRSYDEEIR